jgi:hypothetical protein
VVTALGVWALGPLDPEALPEVALSAPGSSSRQAAALMLAAAPFEACLWHVPELPAEPAPANRPSSPPQPRPAALELVSIIHEPQGLRAALFDPQSDRLLIVAQGERAGAQIVTAIRADAVELSEGPLISILKLAEEEEP